jgi:hypothetical protein
MARHQFTLHGLVLLSCLCASSGCSRNSMSRAEAGKAMDVEIANTLKLGWPAGFTNREATAYSMTSLMEGSRNTIYLSLLNTDSAGITNLVSMLQSNKVTIFGHSPLPDARSKSHASWWNPDEYGQCDTFEISTQQANRLVVLSGFVPQSNRDCKIFLEMRVVDK